jgi:hypothetical protein
MILVDAAAPASLPLRTYPQVLEAIKLAARASRAERLKATAQR